MRADRLRRFPARCGAPRVCTGPGCAQVHRGAGRGRGVVLQERVTPGHQGCGPAAGLDDLSPRGIVLAWHERGAGSDDFGLLRGGVGTGRSGDVGVVEFHSGRGGYGPVDDVGGVPAA